MICTHCGEEFEPDLWAVLNENLCGKCYELFLEIEEDRSADVDLP